METSRRTVLAAAGVGLASLEIGAAAPVAVRTNTAIDKAVAELIRRSAESNAALMRGDIERYRALITLTDDFTLMSPFGGTPSRGFEITDERMNAMGRFFRNGTLEQELVQSYGSADMVVLAIIERAHVEVGGLPAQNWSLRVTLVYRREGTEWRLVHRHADPLVEGVSLEHAAALARGVGAGGTANADRGKTE
jgi:ketosteroid isomerase-like protein